MPTINQLTSVKQRGDIVWVNEMHELAFLSKNFAHLCFQDCVMSCNGPLCQGFVRDSVLYTTVELAVECIECFADELTTIVSQHPFRCETRLI